MLRGLVIEPDSNKAETIKILLENKEKQLGIKIDILERTDKNYLLKNIRKYDFLVTQVTSIDERELNKQIIPYLKLLNNKGKDFVKVMLNKRVVYIDRNDLVGLEVIGKECYVYTRTGKYSLGRIPLRQLIEAIEDPYLVRCHKSYAINLKYVRGFVRETRTRWRPMFVITTMFDGKLTDVYLGGVINRFENLYDVKMSRYFDFK